MIFKRIGRLFRESYFSFVLSMRQLRRGDRNVMIFIAYGLLYDVFLNIYKPFSVKFLDRLGGNAFHISLLNSLPGILAVLALIPGSLFISKFKKKKSIISVLFLISRNFVLLMAFVPLLPIELQPIFFVLLMSLMNFPDAISQSGLQGFLGDIFDGRTRASAITLRNKFGQITVPFITLITGIIVTVIPKNNSQVINIYQIFFVLAFLVGLVEIKTFRKFHEKEKEVVSKKVGMNNLLAVVKDKKFTKYLLTTLLFYFFYQAAWPLFGILQVKDLSANEMHMALTAVGSGIAGFFGAGFWGRVIAKKGNDYASFLSIVHLAASVLLTALSPNIYIYILIQIYGGFVGIGVVITLLNGLLAATPDENRVIYIAVYNTFVNISLGISPFFANMLYNMWGTRISMAIVGVGRILGGLLILLVFHRKKNDF